MEWTNGNKPNTQPPRQTGAQHTEGLRFARWLAEYHAGYSLDMDGVTEDYVKWVSMGRPDEAEENTSIDIQLAEKICEFMNGILKTDPHFIDRIVSTRFQCSKEMVEHPTVQSFSNDGIFEIGLMGILNGITGIDESGWGAICMVRDTETQKVMEFRITPEIAGNYKTQE